MSEDVAAELDFPFRDSAAILAYLNEKQNKMEEELGIKRHIGRVPVEEHAMNKRQKLVAVGSSVFGENIEDDDSDGTVMNDDADSMATGDTGSNDGIAERADGYSACGGNSKIGEKAHEQHDSLDPASTAPVAKRDSGAIGSNDANSMSADPTPEPVPSYLQKIRLAVEELPNSYDGDDASAATPPPDTRTEAAHDSHDAPIHTLVSSSAQEDPEDPPELHIVDTKFYNGQLTFTVGYEAPIWIHFNEVCCKTEFEQYFNGLTEAGWEEIISEASDGPDVELKSLRIKSIKKHLKVEKVLRLRDWGKDAMAVQALTSNIQLHAHHVKTLGLSGEAARICYSKHMSPNAGVRMARRSFPFLRPPTEESTSTD